MKTIVLFAAMCALAGCSTFTTTQIDERVLSDGSRTKITTRASARTLFDAKSQLANFRASQTEKQQGASVGSLSQESNGTNAVAAIQALERIAIGLAKP